MNFNCSENVQMEKNAVVTACCKDVTGKREKGLADLAAFLHNVLKPVGSTLYVWGGGWNAADDGSGETALHVGVWPEWKTWFHRHRNGYSYVPGRISWENGNREQRFFGLDCSGYIGWCLYQMRELERNMSALQTQIPYRGPQERIENGIQRNRRSRTGYVVPGVEMAASLADHGYGSVRNCTPVDAFKSEYDINPGNITGCKDDIGLVNAFRPGDIVSLKGHCFICLGQCEDGSVLLVHSTPNGGVQVSGTVSEGRNSQASGLAVDFMQRYYPEWWESFGCEGRQAVDAFVYLNGAKFSWNMEAIMTDEQNLRNRSACEVLKYLGCMCSIRICNI